MYHVPVAVGKGKELIDTLWNVNDVIYKGTHAARLELIDTLWNVNKLTAEEQKDLCTN